MEQMWRHDQPHDADAVLLGDLETSRWYHQTPQRSINLTHMIDLRHRVTNPCQRAARFLTGSPIFLWKQVNIETTLGTGQATQIVQ